MAALADTMELENSSDDEAQPVETTRLKKGKAKAVVEVAQGIPNEPDFNEQLLRQYYDRLFPYDPMFRWLSYGNDPHSKSDNPAVQKDFFMKREWSFTLADDIYIRYLTFRDAAEMKAGMLKKMPHKIDIGAVYTCPAKDHKTVNASQFRTVERELVFDIDLTDYDEVRTCCTGAKICRKCWSYMTMAIDVLDSSLKEDFGFENILYIYSGRRGVHCWVSDPGARSLSDPARSAVVDYLSVTTTGVSQDASDKMAMKKPDFSWPPHPSLARSYGILEPYFAQHIVPEEGQGIFADPDQWKPILATLPVESIANKLETKWDRVSDRTTASDKWAELCEEISSRRGQSGGGGLVKKQRLGESKELELWKMNLVFHHCYPKLDENVSKMQNHLLKSPFAVHPKTGRVCIPIDPATMDTFDPFEVPTICRLCEEINAYDSAAKQAGQDPKEVPDVDKTSLKHSLAFLEKQFLTPLYRGIHKTHRDAADELAAQTVDF